MWLSAACSAPSDLLMFGWTHPFSFLSSALSHCHVAVSLSQSMAVSDPKQVQLIHSKNASTPTSPTGPASPAWTDKGSAPLSPNPEFGKDFFNMKPWVNPQFCLTGTNLLALLTSGSPNMLLQGMGEPVSCTHFATEPLQLERFICAC